MFQPSRVFIRHFCIWSIGGCNPVCGYSFFPFTQSLLYPAPSLKTGGCAHNSVFAAFYQINMNLSQTYLVSWFSLIRDLISMHSSPCLLSCRFYLLICFLVWFSKHSSPFSSFLALRSSGAFLIKSGREH